MWQWGKEEIAAMFLAVLLILGMWWFATLHTANEAVIGPDSSIHLTGPAP